MLLNPRCAGSNTAEYGGFLRAIEIRSTTFIGEEVKPQGPCRKILRHIKNLSRHERDTSKVKFNG
jgi:hypothetical protein